LRRHSEFDHWGGHRNQRADQHTERHSHQGERDPDTAGAEWAGDPGPRTQPPIPVVLRFPCILLPAREDWEQVYLALDRTLVPYRCRLQLQTGQQSGVLFDDSLERISVEVERTQDGRRNLLGPNVFVDRLVTQHRV